MRTTAKPTFVVPTNERTLTIDVVQGLGDLVWCLQKLYPYFDKINMNILCIDKSQIQTRAQKFMELLPKVGKITYKVVTSEHYDRVAKTPFRLDAILAHPERVHEYACNRLLEDGVRLENIDPGKEVEWNLKFNIPASRVFNFPYITLYVSGSKTDFTWTPHRWANLMIRMYSKLHTKPPLVLLGAEYDRLPLTEVKAMLEANQIQCHLVINNSASDCVRILRDSELFVGYQSGLSIVADLYDVKQVMMYFPFLKPMLNTWCKPGHAESKMFNAFTFDQGNDTVLNGCADVLRQVDTSLNN